MTLNKNKMILYKDYIQHSKEQGWLFEETKILTINDVNNDNSYRKDNIKKGKTGILIRFICPQHKKITYYGKTYDNPYGIGLKIINKNGIEIPDFTKIKINKESSDGIIQLKRTQYCQIKIIENDEMPFKIDYAFELYDSQQFIIYVVNSLVDINIENIQFKMKVDIFKNL